MLHVIDFITDPHVITVVVNDSDGQQASDRVTIHVGSLSQHVCLPVALHSNQ